LASLAAEPIRGRGYEWGWTEAGGQRPGWRAQSFSDLEQDVRESVRRIADSPFIPHKDSIRGFVYDVATGELREVT
jgi:carbonic anhydrase